MCQQFYPAVDFTGLEQLPSPKQSKSLFLQAASAVILPGSDFISSAIIDCSCMTQIFFPRRTLRMWIYWVLIPRVQVRESRILCLCQYPLKQKNQELFVSDCTYCGGSIKNRLPLSLPTVAWFIAEMSVSSFSLSHWKSPRIITIQRFLQKSCQLILLVSIFQSLSKFLRMCWCSLDPCLRVALFCSWIFLRPDFSQWHIILLRAPSAHGNGLDTS